MRVFIETQRFRQWWFILIAIATVSGMGIATYSNYQETGTVGSLFLAFVFVLIIFAGVFYIQLETKINAEGVYTEFTPLHITRKQFSWHEISDCFVCKYFALSQYGGYGIRIFRKAKAYNVDGNRGIQIITKKGEKFLIGTQKPKEAEKVIQRFHHKINQS